MKHLLSSIVVLVLFSAPSLQAKSDSTPTLPRPVLVYDCCLNGTFQFSQVLEPDYDYDDDLGELEEPMMMKSEDCLEGFGVKNRFQLKSFLVIDGDACVVHVMYGECKDEDGKRHKVYWFDSDSYDDYEPDFCDLYVTHPNQVDTVCGGITSSSKSYYRNIFSCYEDVCEIGEESSEGYCNYAISDVLDLAGPITKFKISAAMPPTKAPFKYLNFCYGMPEGKDSRSAEICAPKNLCGFFTSYFIDNNGYTDSSPNFDLLEVEKDLTIGPDYLPSDPVPGYHFGGIFGCYKCRLNTTLTANANLLDAVCGDGDSETGHGFLNMSKVFDDYIEDEDLPCRIEPGELHYGVLLAALYLESKGYRFDEEGLECAIYTALGLPVDYDPYEEPTDNP